MQIILPEPGLFIWTTVIFLIFFLILRRFAWKPIINALHEREYSIEKSLKEAAAARDEMAKLQSENEALLKEARSERDKILRDANDRAEMILMKAKEEEEEVRVKEREKAVQEIEAAKRASIAEIKETAASLAVEVAEKILRKEFSDKSAQENYAKELISDLSTN